jgi:hypothetical protein
VASSITPCSVRRRQPLSTDRTEMGVGFSQLCTTKTTVSGHSVSYKITGCTMPDLCSPSLQLVDELDSPEPKLVPIAERVWLTWRELVLIDIGVVGAVQILDEDLGTLNKDTGVLP